MIGRIISLLRQNRFLQVASIAEKPIVKDSSEKNTPTSSFFIEMDSLNKRHLTAKTAANQIKIGNNVTWEEAVVWLKSQPGQQQLVRDCYFDDPVLEAASRFAASEEWLSTLKFLPAVQGGKALEIGAGRGPGSYALAQAGFAVTALEPDPSAMVGTGAINEIARLTSLPIRTLGSFGENIPCPNERFDVVYARQVLHHAHQLEQLCAEAWRVLKAGGVFIAVREHVIDDQKSLETFLNTHPLHGLYGGENAYPLKEYRRAIQQAGFKEITTLGPADSVINYFPISQAGHQASLQKILERFLGPFLAQKVFENHFLKKHFSKIINSSINRFSTYPGRLYSFICKK